MPERGKQFGEGRLFDVSSLPVRPPPPPQPFDPGSSSVRGNNPPGQRAIDFSPKKSHLEEEWGLKGIMRGHVESEYLPMEHTHHGMIYDPSMPEKYWGIGGAKKDDPFVRKEWEDVPVVEVGPDFPLHTSQPSEDTDRSEDSYDPYDPYEQQPISESSLREDLELLHEEDRAFGNIGTQTYEELHPKKMGRGTLAERARDIGMELAPTPSMDFGGRGEWPVERLRQEQDIREPAWVIQTGQGAELRNFVVDGNHRLGAQRTRLEGNARIRLRRMR